MTIALARTLGRATALLVTVAAMSIAHADDFDDCLGSADPDTTIRACTQVLQGSSAYGTAQAARQARAQAYKQTGNLPGALKDFSDLIATETGAARSDQRIKVELENYLDRAAIYESMLLWNDAVADYNAAAQLIERMPPPSLFNPQEAPLYDRNMLPGIYFMIGRAREANGNIMGAATAYGSAAGNSDYKQSSYVIAWARAVYLDNARSKIDTKVAERVVIPRLDEVITREPGNAEAYFIRGALNRQRRDLARAEADLDNAIRLRSSHADSFYERAMARAGQRKLDGAVADLTSAIALEGGNQTYYTVRGMIQGARGRRDDQIADYSKAVELDPTEPYRYLVRAWALLRAGLPNAALRDVNRAALDVSVPGTRLARGEIYMAMGMKDRAREELRLAQLSDSGKALADALRRLDAMK